VSFDEARIDAIFAELNQCHLPGAAVGIAIDGRTVYRKGFGLAHMELPVVLSPTMRMRIASMTKPFACLAYFSLCHEGRATLDDTVGQHLPDVHPVMHAITMRQLMGHIGGNRDVHDLCYQFSGTGRAVSSEQLFALYRTLGSVNHPPGAAYCYNNGGYLLLSFAIERIAQQPLREVLRERIFEPAGMHDTVLRPVDTDFVPNSATLHMREGGGPFEKSYIGAAYAGEGGMVSTVDDILRWLEYMDRSDELTREAWKAMSESQRLSNGTPTGYGLGLVIDRYRGVETISHAGGLMGGNSLMLKVPAAGLDVVIMVNRHDVIGVNLVNQILDACLPDLAPVSPPRSASPVAAVFQSPRTGRVLELFARDGQQFASIDAFDIPVASDDSGVFRPTGLFANPYQWLRLITGPEGPIAAEWNTYGELDVMTPISGRPQEEQPINGRYVCTEAQARVMITTSSVGLRMDATGAFGSSTYALVRLSENICRARSTGSMPWGGILTFDPHYDTFTFSNYRTHSLRFQRVQ
jgi:CubicO group peptidase (beta-lactamase class C family)